MRRLFTRKKTIRLPYEVTLTNRIINSIDFFLRIIANFFRVVLFIPFAVCIFVLFFIPFIVISLLEAMIINMIGLIFLILDLEGKRKFSLNNESLQRGLVKPFRYKFLKLTEFLFSVKTQESVFLPAMSDWDEETFEALTKNKDAQLFMIHLRNTYRFILIMWQKSPIGDLIEFVRKLAS